MCFFFKRKPKFDWQKVEELIEVAMNNLNMKGFPAPNERNEENWKLEMVNDEYGVGGFLTCTVDGLSWGISMYFSKSFYDLRRGMSFKNTRLSDKHLNELRSKYPFLLFLLTSIIGVNLVHLLIDNVRVFRHFQTHMSLLVLKNSRHELHPMMNYSPMRHG